MSTVPQPACAPCNDGDHDHCRNWVPTQEGGQDYCQCFWRDHVLNP